MENTCILRAEGLSKVYGRRKVVDNLDICINRGDIYGFLGPNGAGKTTTIRMLLGLVRYDCGSVTINGYNIRNKFKHAIRKVGAIVEVPSFYEHYSGYENLQMMRCYYRGISRNKVDEVLEITGISRRAHDKVKTYSLGMKQRLGIARALLHDPEFVILDEPTNGLDPQGMKEIRDMILLLAKERHITFFISTHLLNEVEMICNRVAIINHGKKVVEGCVNELLSCEYEQVDIYTDRIEEACRLAGKSPFVVSVTPFTEGFQARIHHGASVALIKLLVENKFDVRYVTPRKQTLEDYFIEMTKGGEHIV